MRAPPGGQRLPPKQRPAAAAARGSALPPIARVGYRPPSGYALDLEVIPVALLGQRVRADYLRLPERIEFYLLVCATRGQFQHTIDFEPVTCSAGSVLIVRPGQVQRFDTESRWDGWLVLFRPEFLMPDSRAAVDSPLQLAIDELPAYLMPATEDFAAIIELIAGMQRDAVRAAPAPLLHALLRHQLLSLIARLCLLHAEETPGADSRSRELFRRFRLEVNRRHADSRRIDDYARLLGCSVKTLTRTTRLMAGVSAKRYLSQRIALEAKRLLAHTALPVSRIADQLGFDEPTNFIKFFRRESGVVPGVFRQQQHGR